VSEYFIPIILILLVIGALLREQFVFTILYLFIGAYAFGRWWSVKALEAVHSRRTLPSRAFLGEDVKVQLELSNLGRLPVVWLHIHESFPYELAVPSFYQRVISLRSHERSRFAYTLKARKRGYYSIGPLSVSSGDIFGLADQVRGEVPADYLTVFPRIVPLSKIIIPSRSPMGSLRHTQPLFEDPNRVMGKRDYVMGDSLRRVDWKATAATGRIQVKQFEPSIALETCLFLNLNAGDYARKTRIPDTELAIVVAASIAYWVVDKKQSVGLVTNGQDPYIADGHVQPLPPRKGRNHLMRLLEILARIQMVHGRPMTELLRVESHRLPWGTTLILISNHLDNVTFDSLFQARRAGMDVMLVLCGPVRDFQEIRRRAEQFSFPLYQMFSEADLDVWR
jgi:uncharacterized protein (DUF58 family)